MGRIDRIFPKSRDRAPEVDRAVAAWRNADPGRERVSPAARARLLEAVDAGLVPAADAAWRPPLFVPVRVLAWGGLLPALVLALALGSLAVRPHGRDVGGTSVQAVKQGNSVVFRIQNGNRPHTVSRSLDPSGSWETLGTVRGEFRDRIGDDSQLVFYRID